MKLTKAQRQSLSDVIQGKSWVFKWVTMQCLYEKGLIERTTIHNPVVTQKARDLFPELFIESEKVRQEAEKVAFGKQLVSVLEQEREGIVTEYIKNNPLEKLSILLSNDGSVKILLTENVDISKLLSTSKVVIHVTGRKTLNIREDLNEAQKFFELISDSAVKKVIGELSEIYFNYHNHIEAVIHGYYDK